MKKIIVFLLIVTSLLMVAFESPPKPWVVERPIESGRELFVFDEGWFCSGKFTDDTVL